MIRSFSRLIPMLLVAALAIPLGGCSADKVQQAWQTTKDVVSSVSGVTKKKVDRKAVMIAATTANSLIVSFDIYLQQPICNGTTAVCRDPAATETVANVVATLQSARSKALEYILKHPDAVGADGLYDALVTATNEVKAAFQRFGVKIVS